MSEESTQESTVLVEENKLEEVKPVKEVPTKLSDVDRMSLELAKSNKRTALALAEKALAQNEVAELSYKYTVLQLYMRYGLTEADALSEAGDILRGGALKQAGSK